MTILDQKINTLEGEPADLSQYQGKAYRTGFYSLAFGVQYNKEHFDKAGLNADQPPKTWDELMNACDKLKGKGINAIGGGIQDGYWGEWYFGHALAQNVDNPGEVVDQGEPLADQPVEQRRLADVGPPNDRQCEGHGSLAGARMRRPMPRPCVERN